MLKKQVFGKKGKLSSEEMILAYFARSIEHDQNYGTYYKGSRGILTFTLEVIGSILRTLEVAEKTIFRKKNGTLSSEENILA